MPATRCHKIHRAVSYSDTLKKLNLEKLSPASHGQICEAGLAMYKSGLLLLQSHTGKVSPINPYLARQTPARAGPNLNAFSGRTPTIRAAAGKNLPLACPSNPHLHTPHIPHLPAPHTPHLPAPHDTHLPGPYNPHDSALLPILER